MIGDDIKNLADFLDPTGTGQINYVEMIKLMEDPEYINTIPVRNMNFIMTNKGQ